MAAKLSDERHRYFIGRQAELHSFNAALEAASCSLLFVSGPTGVGKTSLLQECQRSASKLGHRVLYVEASELARRGHDEALLSSLALSLESTRTRHSVPRPLLLVDGFEQLSEYDPWLLERLGHELPGDTLLVLASRKEPPQRLMLDRAWAGLTRQIDVPPWNEEQARNYLSLRGIPEAAQSDVLDFAGGYPLALTLATEAFRSGGGEHFGPAQVESVQSSLARLLSLGGSSRAQQLALDVCALSQRTSVELLEHVLQWNGLEDAVTAHELFEWLAHRPFIERVGSSVRPHLLARITLSARVRREQKYEAIFRPVREFWVDQLASGSAAEAGLRALFFLDRDLPFVRSRIRETDERVAFAPAERADHLEIAELVRRHEGDEAAELCRARLRAEPEAFEVAGSGPLNRVLHSVRFATASDVRFTDRDPAARLVKQYILDHPLNSGSTAIFFRWFMAAGDYQSPTQEVLALTARQIQIIMATTQAAYSLSVYRDPDEWEQLWDAAVTPRTVVGRFTMGKHRYSLLAFSFAQGSLRDLLIDARKVPSAPVRPSPAGGDEEQRRKIKQRVAELASSTKLTTREAEILELLSLGVSSEEIAVRLRIRPRTVKFHQENVLRKTGAATRVELFRRLI
ncbi:MAG: LuxR C-terminal-related transcriptional regulator [Polyangiaceae bacterium]